MEAILLQHPGVIGIVIVGIPDARLTEMVIACFQLRENWYWSDKSFEHSTENKGLVLSSEILRHYCREKNLTGYVLQMNDVDCSTCLCLCCMCVLKWMANLVFPFVLPKVQDTKDIYFMEKTVSGHNDRESKKRPSSKRSYVSPAILA